ncbi:MAG: triose-phosphate isomerase [Candidatus Spechtbacterales bacterium]|nr:triose-phosphate isomerase [Candidatus Spechtbacterales bacterium]
MPKKKKSKKIYLAGNWKMNPVTLKQAEKLAKDTAEGFGKIKNKKNVEIILCPPFSYLEAVGRHIPTKSNSINLGAQNCYFEDSGAYTGEVSAKMLKDIGCKYVIIGHSERRKYFREDSELINKKIKSALKHSITPILAVGESDNEPVRIVKEQLAGALEGLSVARAKKLIIAYEPIWAIGTGNAATANDAMSARILIQKVLDKLYTRATANTVPILYGGSTNSKNINTFIKDAEMDGALVGGSSLDAKEFIKMAKQII